MPLVGIRDLSRNTSRIIKDVTSAGDPVIVTDRGRPVAAIWRLDEEALEDFILSHAPEFVRSIAEADEDLIAGRTRSAKEVLTELEHR